MAKRRHALDVELAAFEQRVGEIPLVATAASAAVLSDISGTTVSGHELRRWRLALLLGLPLCGGLVLSLATALMARRYQEVADCTYGLCCDPLAIALNAFAGQPSSTYGIN
jgi:hypothetical protein